MARIFLCELMFFVRILSLCLEAAVNIWVCDYLKKAKHMSELHFNLKDIFAIVLVLLLWHLYLPYTLAAGGVLCVAFVGFGWKYGIQPSMTDACFVTAFLLNLWYVLASWGNVRQYDYFNFVMHTDYFLQNNFFFANPASYWKTVYFQPPLWGFISAFITKSSMWLGATQNMGFDSVRFVSLFCVSGAGILFWRLLNIFYFSEKLKIALFAVFVFFPVQGIVANLVNNDALTYFLMIVMIYSGFKWYLEGKWYDCLYLSLALFLAGLVKFSGLMLVPALGVFCLFRLIQAPDKFNRQMWGQFFIIALATVCGFAWGWFLLYHDFPLVPPPVNNNFQDLSAYSIGQRLGSLQNALIPFADIRNGLTEPNVWLALVKTSLFGEWSWQGMIWAWILYGLGSLFAVACFIAFFSLLNYKLGKDWCFNLFIIVAVFSILAAWMNFWMDYPYFCSSEFRYVLILLPLSLLWLGNWMANKSLPRYLNYILAGLFGLFVVARFMLYLNTIQLF